MNALLHSVLFTWCHVCFAGVIPMLAAPMPGNNDHMMHEAVTAAAKRGLLQPNDHVVCVMSIKDSLVVKVVTMDNLGTRTMRHTDSASGSRADLSQMDAAVSAATPNAVLAPEIKLDTEPLPSRVSAPVT